MIDEDIKNDIDEKTHMIPKIEVTPRRSDQYQAMKTTTATKTRLPKSVAIKVCRYKRVKMHCST